MRLRTVVFLSVATILLAATVLATPAYSAPMAQGSENVPISKGAVMTAAEIEQAYGYWTPDKMANAIPMDLLEAQGQPGENVNPALAVPEGPGMAFPGSAPGQDSKPAVTLEAAGIEPSTFITNYYTYPYPYTWSYMAAGWPNFYPMRTNAKLFFSIGVDNFVCSATVVTDGGAGFNRLVATAGHCVSSGAGVWATNLLVCPAYNNGVGPWGCWIGVNAWTLTPAWFLNADVRYDHGFVIAAHTSTTGYGNIGTAIGTNGVSVNVNYVQDVWSFGYPAAAPYDGKYLVWTTSSTAVIDNVDGLGAPYAWGIGSNETGGSSGGAWSILQKLAAPGYVVGHNDYKYISPAMPLAMFSPYQGNDWLNLYNAARVNNP